MPLSGPELLQQFDHFLVSASPVERRVAKSVVLIWGGPVLEDRLDDFETSEIDRREERRVGLDVGRAFTPRRATT